LQVDREMLGCLNKQCNHCGFRFWIEEHTWGFFRRPHYSKRCALGKFFFASYLHPAKVHGDVTRLTKCRIA
jgi:hypothetical protein